MSKQTYKLNYHCSNCDFSGPHEIPFGTAAPKTLECVHCGCQTASRAQNSPLGSDWQKRIEPYIRRHPSIPQWPPHPRIVWREQPVHQIAPTPRRMTTMC